MKNDTNKSGHGKQPTVLYVEKGAKVLHNGREYLVLRVVDLNLVLARDPASDEKVLLKISTMEDVNTGALPGAASAGYGSGPRNNDVPGADGGCAAKT